jgi:D-citramalate synthase
VFTQTAGIHADGDAKGELYANRLLPSRFGRKRRYALGKMSGKASLQQNLRDLGIELTPEHRDLVLARIVELGDKKHQVTREDLPMLIADVLRRPDDPRVQIEFYDVRSSSGQPPQATLRLAHRGRTAEASSSGDGGYDALMKALARAARTFSLALPTLVDYKVRIAPGGRSEALVETVITWRRDARSAPFTTIGVDSDQLAAAVIATEKMLNVIAAETTA